MSLSRFTSIFAIVSLLAVASSASAAFPDVPSLHVDAKAIAYLEEHLIFRGKPVADGVTHFDPNAPLNRAELVTILIRALGVDIHNGSQSCFKDVQTGAWYFNAVCSAERMGIISGYPDGTFKPAQVVNKVESLKIIANAIGLSSEAEMYASYDNNLKKEWYSPYLTLVSEWKLLDETRIEKKPDAFMTRADIAHLLYRTIITAMHRTATGDIPAFNEDLAVQYEDRKVEFSGLEEAAAFEKLYENGKEYRNERLGFSLLLPKTMPTYMCDYQKPATLVEVNAVEKGNDVYIGPAWYEENEYLGENPDGSGRYGECKRHEMQVTEDAYFTRIIRTRVVKNDSEIESFIKENFGKECGPFERQPSAQIGIEDLKVKNVPRPGVKEPSGLDDFVCVTNYAYVLKYNPVTKRVLGMNLGQDGFIYLPKEDGTFGRALDMTIMRTLRMF
jgi:hypothetical protein